MYKVNIYLNFVFITDVKSEDNIKNADKYCIEDAIRATGKFVHLLNYDYC